MTTALVFDPTPDQEAWQQRFDQALAACATPIDRLAVIMRDFWFPDVVEGYEETRTVSPPLNPVASQSGSR